MRRLRTFLGVDDDLQAFASRWLNESSLWNAQSIAYADGALVTCLYRDETFQVELCAVPPGFVIPDHTHPNADTIEVTVAGVLRLRVNSRDVYAGMTDEYVQRLNRTRGIRINRSDVHGTIEPVGTRGALFLSIQKWSCVPASVLTDYLGAPLGEMHRGMVHDHC